MATTALCTIADVRNRLSADGVTYRVDDTPPTDYGDAIDEASQTIYEYCLMRYEESDLAASQIVNHWAANIAAYYLCERRGNPVPIGIAQKFGRTIEKLEKVVSGSRFIPDIAARKEEAPVMSNVRIRLDPFPRTVVERHRSTGTPAGYKQHSDKLDYLDYSI